MWHNVAIGVVVMLTPVVAAEGYLLWGSSWHARTKAEIGIYASESDAAYRNSLANRTNPPITVLPQNKPVAVLWDWYGKDYWACYVRSASGTRGWVLCTSLSKVSAGA